MIKKKYPDRLFYKIGEVCKITDTQPYVLRFWESEFSQLAPKKNRAGQRVYRKEDIELIFKIKELLYDEEFTIAGARKKLGMNDSDETEHGELFSEKKGRKIESREKEPQTGRGDFEDKIKRIEGQLQALLTALDKNDKKIKEIEMKLRGSRTE